MRWPEPPVMDRRTDLERAREELAGNLRQHGDPVTVAAIVRFADDWAARLRSKAGMDYSAEGFAIGRLASEIALAAEMAGTRLPSAEQLAVIMAPEPEPVLDPDLDLDRLLEHDLEREGARRHLDRIIHKPENKRLPRRPRSSKWNRRRNKRSS